MTSLEAANALHAAIANYWCDSSLSQADGYKRLGEALGRELKALHQDDLRASFGAMIENASIGAISGARDYTPPTAQHTAKMEALAEKAKRAANRLCDVIEALDKEYTREWSRLNLGKAA